MTLRVLYVIDNLTHGGTEKQLVALMGCLDRKRVEPYLCTLGESDALYGELDVPKTCLHFNSFLHPSTAGCLLRLVRYVRENRIELVQTFFQDPFLLAAMSRPLTGTRLVGSFRDLGFWRTRRESTKMRFSYPMFSGFIANSHAVKDYIVEMDGIAPERIEVLYNGIDLAKIPTRTSRSGDAPLVGIVANLNRPVKRVEDFIEAAAIIHARRPETRFVVVGDGHLAGSLARLAEDRGIAEATRFLGRIPQPLEIIRDLDVGVISSATEGFCNALVEYMACGVPVVATDTGGNPELVREGESGFLVPVGAPQAMAERVLTLLADADRAARIGRANALRIRDSFSLDAMAAAHCDYYEKLLNR